MTDLPMSTRCIKYVLFIFNLLFVITGVIILSVGASVHDVYGNYTDFLDTGYMSTSAFLVAVGTIIFIISFFGCCGALKENYCMIVTFTCLLVLVFIFEFAAGISGYVLKDRTRDLIETNLHNTMMQYTTDKNNAEKFDVLQRTFTCCGINNYSDWHAIFNNDSIPISCCNIPYQTVDTFNCTAKASYFYSQTCIDAFGNFVQDHALTLGGVGIALAIIQLIGIIFACHLCRQIKLNYPRMS